MLRAPLCLLAAALIFAADETGANGLGLLPAPAKPAVATAAAPPFDPAAGTELAPGAGVRLVKDQRVVLDGAIQVDKGPVDGLEVLACLREGKTHETLVRLAVADGAVVKAAMLAAFGAADGRPAGENSAIPARGTPMRLTLLWKDEDGAWRWIDAASLVRDRRTDRPFPPLPWVYTGSRVLLIAEQGPDGRTVRRERFMLDTTRSVAVNYDEPDALLASPFPCADQDARFEVNSSLCPPPGTRVHLAIAPAESVLQLRLDATGALARDGTVLDDATLAAALAGAFAGTAKPAHHAVAIRTAVGTGDDLVVAARARLLAAAAAAQVWCVPLFQAE